MKQSAPWQLVLRNYRKSENPAERARCQIWLAALGLQGVDALNPSGYFVNLVCKHIEGKCMLPAMENQLLRHYKWFRFSEELTEETWEADLCSLHIAQLLLERSFRLEPAELRKIHHRLFQGVFDFAGDFRSYDIRKKEWILKGNSVCYEDFETLEASLNRYFAEEQAFSYQGLTADEIISHLARFIESIWLTHPYGEGNTRTTAVFLMRYLKFLHFKMKREVFMEAWYFRNTLVRASYQNAEEGIAPDFHFLELFLENLLLGTDHPMRNQELHVDFPNIDM